VVQFLARHATHDDVRHHILLTAMLPCNGLIGLNLLLLEIDDATQQLILWAAGAIGILVGGKCQALQQDASTLLF
jgi:hypothetical protein